MPSLLRLQRIPKKCLPLSLHTYMEERDLEVGYDELQFILAESTISFILSNGGVGRSMANSACSWEIPSPSQGSSWASYVATQQKETASGSSSLVVCRKPSSRKRKIAMEEDPLEDTACSSPAKPPKATTCNIQSEVDDGLAKIKDVRNNEVDGLMKSSNGSGEQLTDLRKKGLCLVPLSTLIDFLQQLE